MATISDLSDFFATKSYAESVIVPKKSVLEVGSELFNKIYNSNLNWRYSDGAANTDYTSICWSSELGIFCAVSPTNYEDATNAMISSDGIIWDSVNIEGQGWYSVCWSDFLHVFCAVGPSNVVATSADGINWDLHPIATDSAWKSVCWASGLRMFVAVASAGTDRVMNSEDGDTWHYTDARYANAWYSVCYSPYLNRLVAVSTSGESTIKMMYSDDGDNWYDPVMFTTDAYWKSVCWSQKLSLFVAVA
jgi:hypothetical protein